jgi:hypothetical protein
MTSGSSLEIVGWPRSIGGFYGVQACSVVFMVMRWIVLKKAPEVATTTGIIETSVGQRPTKVSPKPTEKAFFR